MENIEEKLMELKKKLIEFEENKKYFKQFNIFETLKITNAEIRHSNIFAWLLNPQGSHGLKTKFLKRFIEDINKSSNNPIEFSSKAYQSFKIRREWNFIDLTLIHKEMQSIIIIENKIWSNESDHQLESYQKIIEANYPNYTKKYVYLTPFGEKPSNQEIWQTYNYTRIYYLLSELMETEVKNINHEVKIFIEHYLDTLRRNIVGDKELQSLCLKIYNEHKEAIDLIIENLPHERDIYWEIVTNYLEQRDDILLDDSIKRIIRFIPRKLDGIIPKTSKEWTKTGRLLLFEIENFENILRLKTVIGPTVGEGKKYLLDAIEKLGRPDLFNNLNIEKQQQRKYSHIHSEMIIDKQQYDVQEEGFIDFIHHSLEQVIEKYINNVVKALSQLEINRIVNF